VVPFFVDAILTGRVLGIGPTATPDEATSALGGDYTENQLYEDAMWRDYGVVEVHWTRTSPMGPWLGHHISIQTHRLGDDDDPDWDPMNANIRDAYGNFRTRLRFDALQEALSARACVLIPLTRPKWDVLEFIHPATGASVLVTTMAMTTGLDVGDVWQIALTRAMPDRA
jgi:hypothetical protein